MKQELQMVVDTLISEMGKMEARINGRMDERFDRNDKRFEQIDQRFEKIDQRFEQIDRRFEQVDERFDRMDQRMDQMDQRMDRIEDDMKIYVNMLVDEMGRMETRIDKRFQKVDERFDRMDVRLDSMQHEINGCKLACETVGLLMQRVDQHETRIERLEKRSGIGKMLPVGNGM